MARDQARALGLEICRLALRLCGEYRSCESWRVWWMVVVVLVMLESDELRDLAPGPFNLHPPSPPSPKPVAIPQSNTNLTSASASARVTFINDLFFATEAKSQVRCASLITPVAMLRCYAASYHENWVQDHYIGSLKEAMYN